MKTFSLVLIAAIPLLASACTPKPADTQGDESTGDGETSSDGESGGAEETSATAPTSPTSGATEGGATEGTSVTATTETVTSANPTTADPTTTDPTEDPPPGSLPAACEKLCDALMVCEIETPPGCVQDCVGDELPECVPLKVDQTNCLAMLSCAELEQAIMGDPPQECADEIEAYAEACAHDDECSGFAGGGVDSCSIGQDCNGVLQEYDCEGDTCTCVENDVPGKQCPNMNLCGDNGGDPDFDALSAAAQACCGWDWM